MKGKLEVTHPRNAVGGRWGWGRAVLRMQRTRTVGASAASGPVMNGQDGSKAGVSLTESDAGGSPQVAQTYVTVHHTSASMGGISSVVRQGPAWGRERGIC